MCVDLSKIGVSLSISIWAYPAPRVCGGRLGGKPVTTRQSQLLVTTTRAHLLSYNYRDFMCTNADPSGHDRQGYLRYTLSAA